jgi:hypothetical protein
MFGETVEEILHQLIDGKHPIIYKVSTIQGGQDFATIHRSIQHHHFFGRRYRRMLGSLTSTMRTFPSLA